SRRHRPLADRRLGAGPAIEPARAGRRPHRRRSRAPRGGRAMRILVVATFLVAALAAAAGQAEPALLRAYLIAWLLWLGVGLGALVFLCVHHLVRGRWGDA